MTAHWTKALMQLGACADAVAWAHARAARLRDCADLVRQHYPTQPRLRGAR